MGFLETLNFRDDSVARFPLGVVASAKTDWKQ
jgi:hypothetical protein